MTAGPDSSQRSMPGESTPTNMDSCGATIAHRAPHVDESRYTRNACCAPGGVRICHPCFVSPESPRNQTTPPSTPPRASAVRRLARERRAKPAGSGRGSTASTDRLPASLPQTPAPAAQPLGRAGVKKMPQARSPTTQRPSGSDKGPPQRAKVMRPSQVTRIGAHPVQGHTPTGETGTRQAAARQSPSPGAKERALDDAKRGGAPKVVRRGPNSTPRIRVQPQKRQGNIEREAGVGQTEPQGNQRERLRNQGFAKAHKLI